MTWVSLEQFEKVEAELVQARRERDMACDLRIADCKGRDGVIAERTAERDALRAALEREIGLCTFCGRTGLRDGEPCKFCRFMREALRGTVQPKASLDEKHGKKWEVHTQPMPYASDFDFLVTDDDQQALEAAQSAVELRWDNLEPGQEFTVRVVMRAADQTTEPP